MPKIQAKHLTESNPNVPKMMVSALIGICFGWGLKTYAEIYYGHELHISAIKFIQDLYLESGFGLATIYALIKVYEAYRKAKNAK